MKQEFWALLDWGLLSYTKPTKLTLRIESLDPITTNYPFLGYNGAKRGFDKLQYYPLLHYIESRSCKQILIVYMYIN